MSSYTLAELLCEDGDTALYRAHSPDGRPVLARSVKHDKPTTAEYESLRREAEGAKLAGADVAAEPEGVMTVDGRATLVLRDDGAVSLVQLMRTRMEIDAFFPVALGLVEAVAKIHARRLICGELRPSDILVLPSGGVRLTGLGQSVERSLRRAAGVRRHSSTWPYLAPEQIGPLGIRVDHRADLYAVGVVLFEMLTGRSLFAAKDLPGWSYAHCALAPPDASTFAPAVPSQLCRIVEKLLAKRPEPRYQTTAALAYDLERCFESWKAHHYIERFPLGEHDTTPPLPVSTHVHGRHEETQRLRLALESVCRTRRLEAVFVSGPDGIGKTTLVETLDALAISQGALIAFATCPPATSNVPAGPLLEALDGLIRALTESSNDSPESVRSKLEAALGVNVALLSEWLPELAQLVAAREPPCPPAVPGAKNRLRLACDRLLSTLAATMPLVIVLEDLQWADAATLEVLEHWATALAHTPMLIVGTYRSGDMPSDHPLRRTMRRMSELGASASELSLEPLEGPALEAWIADVLQSTREDAGPLSAAVLARTGGNPLFVVRMLESFRRSGLLGYDADARAWRWSLERIVAQPRPSHVGELIADEIAALSPGAQQELGVLAVRSRHIELATCAAAVGASEEEALALIGDAFAARLVTRVEAELYLVHHSIESIVSEQLGKERAKSHLRVARALVAAASEAPRGERLFAVVHHFGEASELLVAPEERIRVAELALLAGGRARAAAEYEAAAAFFSRGIAWLSAADWELHHALAFDLHVALARTLHAMGELAPAEELADTLGRYVRSPREATTVRQLLADVHLARGAARLAVSDCLDGLRALGVDVMEHPPADIVGGAVSAVLGRLPAFAAGAEAQNVLDPDGAAACDLIASLLACGVRADSNLLALAAANVAERALLQTSFGGCALAFAIMGVHLARDGRHEEAFRLGDIAYRLTLRDEMGPRCAQASLAFLGQLSWLSLPVRTCLDRVEIERATAASIGDHGVSSLFAREEIRLRFFAGELLADVADALEQMDGASSATAGLDGDPLVGLRRLVHRLRGIEPREVADTHPSCPLPLRFYDYHYDVIARFLFGDYSGAARDADVANGLTGTVVGTVELAEHHFYAALAKAAVDAPSSADVAARRLEEIREHDVILRKLAEVAPANFGARAALVSAEIARISGNELDVARAYEWGIQCARASGQIHLEAIASERAAHFHRAHGRTAEAEASLAQAYACYESWGAAGKALRLAATFPSLRPPPLSAPELAEVVRAQQSLASAFSLEDLQRRVLQLALELAPAKRGCLLEVTDGCSMSIAVASDESSFGVADVLLGPRRLPVSICRAALGSKRPVSIADRGDGHRYARDPYFASTRVSRALAIPISNAAQMDGVLYLEDEDDTRPFASGRIAVLERIAAHAAIAMESARRYTLTEREIAEVRLGERRLAERARLLEAILDATPVTVFVKDAAGRYVLINRRFEHVHYSNRREIAGKTDHDLFPKEIADAFRRDDLRTLEGDHPVFIEEELPEVDGRHAYFTIKVPLRDGAGKKYAVCGIATDVTTRKRAEEELRSSFSLVEATIESTADGIIVTGIGGELVRYNRRFLSMWSIPDAVIASRDLWRVVAYVLDQLADPGQFLTKLDALLADSEAESFDSILFKDGKVFERYSIPQRVADRTVGRVWSFRDVTQRVRAAEERTRLLVEERRAREEAELAVRIRDEFLSVASHELRTPLTGLSLAVDSLAVAMDGPLRLDRVRGAVAIAKRQVRRIIYLVDMLLDVTKIRGGKLVLCRAKVDLRNVVEDVAALLAAELERSGSTLVVSAPEAVVGHWDGARLEQVVTNLLTNAIKFGRGRPIEVNVARRGESAWLSVSDQGIGIAPESQAQVFEPFTRFVSARHYGGLGLGLHISKTIVEAHGGTLTVESTEGGGSTFTAILPFGADATRP